MTTSSAACQTCKNRRIKCDETKPICRRCTKSRRICVPASDTKQLSFSMHSENQFASGQAKRPRGPRSSFIVQQPELDLEAKALAYYSQYYLQTIQGGLVPLGGLSECVAAWKASGRSDPMVDLALSSMALAVYANTQNESVALKESSARYYRLLQMAQDRIAKVELPSLNEKDVDACLLTIFLMGRYETVTSWPGEQNPREFFNLLQSWSHHEGNMAMLQVWHDKLSHTPPSEIVKEARRGQIRSAILRSRVFPEWLHDGGRYGEQSTELEYDKLAVRLVLLRQSLACAQQDRNVSIERVEKLNQEAQNISRELESWMVPFQRDCPRSEHLLTELEDFPRRYFYSNKIFTYLQLGHAGIWSQFLGAKLLVICTRLKILELGNPDLLTYCTYRGQRTTCIKRLEDLAEDLASMVPFCLQRVEILNDEPSSIKRIVLKTDDNVIPYLTGLLVWQLTIASSIDGISSKLQQWFRSELTNIGRMVGDGMLASADTEAWTISM